jgi:hypothetical protein
MLGHPHADRRDVEHLPMLPAHLRRPCKIVPATAAAARLVPTDLIKDRDRDQRRARMASCPPGLRAPRRRNDFGTGLANPPELGGFEEFFEV